MLQNNGSLGISLNLLAVLCVFETRLFSEYDILFYILFQVHGSQSIELIRPIPKASGKGWKLEKRVVGVHENSAFFGIHSCVWIRGEDIS